MSYQNGEALRTQVEREDLKGVSYEHRRVSDVIEEVEREDQPNGSWRQRTKCQL